MTDYLHSEKNSSYYCCDKVELIANVMLYFCLIFPKFALQKGWISDTDTPYRRARFEILQWCICIKKSRRRPPRWLTLWISPWLLYLALQSSSPHRHYVAVNLCMRSEIWIRYISLLPNTWNGYRRTMYNSKNAQVLTCPFMSGPPGQYSCHRKLTLSRYLSMSCSTTSCWSMSNILCDIKWKFFVPVSQ